MTKPSPLQDQFTQAGYYIQSPVAASSADFLAYKPLPDLPRCEANANKPVQLEVYVWEKVPGSYPAHTNNCELSIAGKRAGYWCQVGMWALEPEQFLANEVAITERLSAAWRAFEGQPLDTNHQIT